MRIERSSTSIFLLSSCLLLAFALGGLLQWQIALAGIAGGIIVFVGYWFSMAGFDHARFIGVVVLTLLSVTVYRSIGGVTDKAQIAVILGTALMLLSAIAMVTKRLRQPRD
jgi:hypothetical protein